MKFENISGRLEPGTLSHSVAVHYGITDEHFPEHINVANPRWNPYFEPNMFDDSKSDFEIRQRLRALISCENATIPLIHSRNGKTRRQARKDLVFIDDRLNEANVRYHRKQEATAREQERATIDKAERKLTRTRAFWSSIGNAFGEMTGGTFR